MKKIIIPAAVLLLLMPVSGLLSQEGLTGDDPAADYGREAVAAPDLPAEAPAAAEFSGEPVPAAPDDAEFLAKHSDEVTAAEESAPLPRSGQAPHILVLPHENGKGYTVTDDQELNMWEKEDYWYKMHEDMPSCCKPYLEDTPWTGANNVEENEISINFGRSFIGTIGYAHYYRFVSIRDIEDPRVCASVKGFRLVKCTVKDGDTYYTEDGSKEYTDKYVYFLEDGDKRMFVPFVRDRLYDVVKTEGRYALLFGNEAYVYAQYIYPGGLEGKDLSYTYTVYSAEDTAGGRFLTDNIVRLQSRSGRVRHWQVKQSEADLANYSEGDFPRNQDPAFKGIWKFLRSRKRLLWTSDPEDPVLHFIPEDMNCDAYNFNPDTRREPAYTD